MDDVSLVFDEARFLWTNGPVPLHAILAALARRAEAVAAAIESGPLASGGYSLPRSQAGPRSGFVIAVDRVRVLAGAARAAVMPPMTAEQQASHEAGETLVYLSPLSNLFQPTFDTINRLLDVVAPLPEGSPPGVFAEQDAARLRRIIAEVRLVADDWERSEEMAARQRAREGTDGPHGTADADPRSGLTPAVARAGASLEWVRRERPDLAPRGDDRRSCSPAEYEYIREHGAPAYPPDESGRSTVPAWPTWSRYVREYFLRTEGPRAPARGGIASRSAVPRQELADHRTDRFE